LGLVVVYLELGSLLLVQRVQQVLLVLQVIVKQVVLVLVLVRLRLYLVP